MEVLIVYDSTYSNTEKIARSLSRVIEIPDRVKILGIASSSRLDIKTADLIVVGSPTHGGRPTQNLQDYLKALPPNIFTGKLVAVFDTRFSISEQGLGLRLLMRVIGFAAPRLAKSLTANGGTLVGEPEGFIVKDKKGPLKEGEIERAQVWFEKILGELPVTRSGVR